MKSQFLKTFFILFGLMDVTQIKSADASHNQQLSESDSRDLFLESTAGHDGEDPTRAETEAFVELLKKGTVDWKSFFNQSTAAKMSWGVALEGPQPYYLNSQNLMTPASVTKVFVTGALLSKAKGSDRIATRIYWEHLQGGVIQNLQIIGSGDPTWGEKDFGESLTSRVDEVVLLLKSRGVTAIRGPIKVEGSNASWNTVKRHPGWKDSFATQCMAALAQSINLNSNCARFQVNSATSGKWLESGVPVAVKMSVSKGSSTSLSVEAIDTASVDSYSYEITGRMAQGASRTFYLPIHRAPEWFKNLLIEAIKKSSIQDLTQESMLRMPSTPQEGVLQSIAISEILKPYLKDSVNFIGDALFKYAGGLEALQKFNHEAGVDSNLSILYDGSGLSYSNRASADGILQVLNHMKNSPEFESFYNALSIAGVDGTLKSRMKKTSAAGVLRAKTGTLDKISNLAGYIPKFDASEIPVDYVPFVILSGTKGYTSSSRTVQNKVGAALSTLVKKE